MSLLVKLVSTDTSASSVFNAEAIIMIRPTGASSILLIDNHGSTTSRSVQHAPMEVVRKIDQAAMDLPAQFRNSALFVPIQDNTVHGTHINVLLNLDKVAMMDRAFGEERTTLHVAGSMRPRQIHETPEEVQWLGQEALKHRMASPSQPAENVSRPASLSTQAKQSVLLGPKFPG